jgi:hypothetical protein
VVRALRRPMQRAVSEFVVIIERESIMGNDGVERDVEHAAARRSAADLAEEQRMRRAFGDDVALRFLKLRGIDGESARATLLASHAAEAG